MARKKVQKSKPSKNRSSRKAHDAFRIAQRAESRGSKAGDDSDSENDVFDGVMDASKFLNREEEEFEDEELDSDEALGSDDDYDVLNSKFSQTIRDRAKAKKLKGNRPLLSDDEEEDGYSSVDESQWVTLSQAWDMDENEKKGSSQSSKNDVVLKDDNSMDDENSDELQSDENSDEDEDLEREQDLEDEDIFEVSGDEDEADAPLTTTLANISSKLKQPETQRKRLVTESREESIHSLPTGGKTLSLNDMIAAVDHSVAKDAILIDEPEKELRSKALATPLPVNIQKRHDRKAAYEIANEEVSKWDDTVQQNRRAEVLKFPINPEVKHNDSAMTFRADSEPSTDLEKKVQDLLQQSALVDDKKEATFEEIAVAKLAPEELKKRTNELRLMRELMFREEKRAKRIKKIKSKAYRRVHKKDRLRNQELVEGLEDEEDQDLKRSRERMTLKHKTQSLWAKSMIKSGLSKDAENRADLEEMLRQGERLRSKQLGHEEGEQSDSGVSELEEEYENDKEDDNRANLGKGVLAMDFMRDAEERKRNENLREIEETRQLEEGLTDFSEDPTSVSITKNQGRRVYTPAAQTASAANAELNETLQAEIEEDEAHNLAAKMSGKVTKTTPKTKLKTSADLQEEAEQKDDEDGVNPWLAAADTHAKSSKISTVEKESSKQVKAAHKISKHKKGKSSNAKENLIDIDDTIRMRTEGEEFDDSETHMFQQRDLIKEAFAGDDVMKEFEAEKKQVIRDEGDKVEDLTLPGWGDWAGGNRKRKKNKVVRTIDGVVQKDKRQDRTKKNVIINEKVNKKNLKYQSSGVPFPFESREQYERSLRMPVGQEWTSRETHQKLTMPRVIVKQGTVIDPIKAPFK